MIVKAQIITEDGDIVCVSKPFNYSVGDAVTIPPIEISED